MTKKAKKSQKIAVSDCYIKQCYPAAAMLFFCAIITVCMISIYIKNLYISSDWIIIIAGDTSRIKSICVAVLKEN